MILRICLWTCLSIRQAARANGAHYDYDADSQPSLPLPSSPLPWSHLNILSTTDTHGWVRGHTPGGIARPVPEYLYSADLGDLASFHEHMQAAADERGADLLFVDAGDQLDGNGFVDADTSRVKGRAARELLADVGWDITTTGNHELYNVTVARDVVDRFVPRFRGGYLASNVYIRRDLVGKESGEGHPVDIRTDSVEKESGEGNSAYVPLGSRYTRLTTKNLKLNITAFGVLFNFDRPDTGLKVHSPKEMVEEDWWKAALQDESVKTDVFVLVGHMATRDRDWQVVQKSIRRHHPTTPILIFSGHAHVRDCVRLDRYTQVMAAGRYMETVGFTSLYLPHLARGAGQATNDLQITRRYLDANLATYTFHTNTTHSSFSTSLGKSIKARMAAYASSFNLSYTFGYAPQTYYLNRYPTTHPKSLINLYATRVFYTVLKPPIERENAAVEPVFLFNTGAARFDIFQGRFTVDDQFAVVPFENAMWYVKGLDRDLVDRVLVWLNRREGEPELLGGEDDGRNARIMRDSMDTFKRRRREVEAFAASNQQSVLDGPSLVSQDERHKTFLQQAQERDKVTYGYVTADLCGPTPGDDTPHRPLPAFYVPDFVLSTRPEGSVRVNDGDKVDLVFYEFIAPLVLQALNALCGDGRRYTRADVGLYSHLKANELLGEYARKEWPLPSS